MAIRLDSWQFALSQMPDELPDKFSTASTLIFQRHGRRLSKNKQEGEKNLMQR